MPDMAVDTLVRCRVSAETKALLQNLAAREHLTESALVRQLIETLVRSSSPLAESDAQERGARGERMSVRLAPDDRQLLAKRATARGMPSATYVAVLVRSHLRKLTPLPSAELAALKRCITQQGALTAHFRQLARAMSQGVSAPSEVVRKDFASMLRVSETLWEAIKGLLKANRESWERGYADTPRPE
jgi:predicted DNA binding CopG/RHH family protein